MNNSTSLSSIQQDHSPTTTFPRFPDLPTEVRLMIWHLSVPIDFDPCPIHLKPYSTVSHHHRLPPKTSHINRESRQETLKHFQRLEIKSHNFPGPKRREGDLTIACDKRTPEDHPLLLHKFRDLKYQWWHLTQISQPVWWNKEIDILTVDWWAIVANAGDILSYLGLKPFVNRNGTVTSVQKLEVDTGVLKPGEIMSRWGAKLPVLLEQNLKYFARLEEVSVVFVDPGLRGSGFIECVLIIMLSDCFKQLVEQNKGYNLPRLKVISEDVDRKSRMVKRVTVWEGEII